MTNKQAPKINRREIPIGPEAWAVGLIVFFTVLIAIAYVGSPH
jgi:hypothetical protein